MTDSPRSDPQREQVYKMESDEFGRHAHHRASRKLLQGWLKEMAKLLSVPAPKLRFGDCGAQYGAVYDSNNHTITMSPRGGPCLLLLCHEFAHYFVFLTQPTVPDHGPAFCLTYMTLLDAMRLVPEEGFRAAARRHGVKISRGRTRPPPRLCASRSPARRHRTAPPARPHYHATVCSAP